MKIKNEIGDEASGESEERLGINKVPLFQSKFNFSEKKGNKLHPDDFNTLKGFNCKVHSKSQRIIKNKFLPSSINSNSQKWINKGIVSLLNSEDDYIN